METLRVAAFYVQITDTSLVLVSF